jgi:hypothetical protein
LHRPEAAIQFATTLDILRAENRPERRLQRFAALPGGFRSLLCEGLDRASATARYVAGISGGPKNMKMQ